MSEIDEFLELTKKVSPDSMEFSDQVIIAAAFSEMMDKTKPIFLKYALRDPNVTNFIVKL